MSTRPEGFWTWIKSCYGPSSSDRSTVGPRVLSLLSRGDCIQTRSSFKKDSKKLQRAQERKKQVDNTNACHI